MKRTRLAMWALSATLLLGACSGSTPAIIGNGGNGLRSGGQQSNLRFVHADPQSGILDIYVQASGAPAPTAPQVSAMQFGNITNFLQNAPVAYSVIVRTAGASASAPPLVSCPIPQLATNGKYTVAIVHQAGVNALNCAMFQELDYVGRLARPVWYRFHHVAQYSPAPLSYGMAPAAYAGSFDYTVYGTATLGALALGSSSLTYTQVTPVDYGYLGEIDGFVVGPPADLGTTQLSFTALPLTELFQTGTGTPTFTDRGTIISPGGASVFAVDCFSTVLARRICKRQLALIGAFDAM